ncbi:hypothetical protein NE237_019416 [Protea cynaroides]|uniref:Uncharacterized protein n=1 Tax=Protea cynaroides TaxID=273540 RepID=A0A9Q0KBS3_9MAGN|nr:hypothetical protein NE237_019416 [Protea cynaroides]
MERRKPMKQNQEVIKSYGSIMKMLNRKKTLMKLDAEKLMLMKMVWKLENGRKGVEKNAKGIRMVRLSVPSHNDSQEVERTNIDQGNFNNRQFPYLGLRLALRLRLVSPGAAVLLYDII